MEYEMSDAQRRGFEMNGRETTFFLVGLLCEFTNRLQTKGDTFFEEISWKQFFLLMCVKMQPSPPTIRELADTSGTSHQNVRKLLLRLEKAGYVTLAGDENDRRKQRVLMTEKAERLSREYNELGSEFMRRLFEGVSTEKTELAVSTVLGMNENLKKIRVDTYPDKIKKLNVPERKENEKEKNG